MDFERKVDGDKLVYECKSDKVFEFIINAICDYRNTYFRGVKEGIYPHKHANIW